MESGSVGVEASVLGLGSSHRLELTARLVPQASCIVCTVALDHDLLSVSCVHQNTHIKIQFQQT